MKPAESGPMEAEYLPSDPEELKVDLKRLLDQVGQRRIWRSVYDEQGRLLAKGHADLRDGPAEILSRVDFSGRKVIDVGCNFGSYSFLAAKSGAASVLGVDIDEMVIRGARMLRALCQADNVDFRIWDFYDPGLEGQFDLALLVNFIGKRRAQKGVTKCLDVARNLAREALVITAAHAYHIPTSLEGDRQGLLGQYPAEYIRDDYFLLTDFMRDYLSPDWTMSLISPAYPELNVKRTLVFVRN